MEGDLPKVKQLVIKLELINSYSSSDYLINSNSKSTESANIFTPRKMSLKSLSLNKYGWTALNAACYFGHLNIIKYLIESVQCDPNQANQNGWHSLIFAIMGSTIYSHINFHAVFNIVEYLLSLPMINAQYKDKSGNDALHYAKTLGPLQQGVVFLIHNHIQHNKKKDAAIV